MKFLIIDRDTVTTQLLQSKLVTLGHEVDIEPSKSAALNLMIKERHDGIFLDPAPLNNARPVVSGLRRSVNYLPYVTIVSADIDEEEGIKAGANYVLSKPTSPDLLGEIAGNVERLVGLIKHLGDETIDFPSAGGVIAKSAVNQLFLSALERADRYAETTFMVFIGIENYDDIFNLDGKMAANYSAAKLSRHLVNIRRQSDIIAQTGQSEYCLLLQRPRYNSEPIEAARRFADSLSRIDDITEVENSLIKVNIRLLEIPSGKLHANYLLEFNKDGLVKDNVSQTA